MDIKSLNLNLLKKLVSELELAVKSAELTKDQTDFVVELAKSSGLAVAIADEATMLITDFKALAYGLVGGTAKQEDFAKLLTKALPKIGSKN